jgi:hypothetical protein
LGGKAITIRAKAAPSLSPLAATSAVCKRYAVQGLFNRRPLARVIVEDSVEQVTLNGRQRLAYGVNRRGAAVAVEGERRSLLRDRTQQRLVLRTYRGGGLRKCRRLACQLRRNSRGVLADDGVRICGVVGCMLHHPDGDRTSRRGIRR